MTDTQSQPELSQQTPWNPAVGSGSAQAPALLPDTRHPTPETRSSSSIWTIPLLCAGIAILACCLLIPAADENRKLTWERERLKADLEQIQKQVSVNDAFLQRLMADPTLSEHLARRQMRMVREGTSVLEMKAEIGKEELSPFLLVTLPPPAAMPEYQPVGGVLANVCRDPKTQLYATGAGLLMIAFGLVLGSSSPTKD